MADDTLKTTPLDALHIELGAKMVPFAGYSMPVQYPAGVLTEQQLEAQAAGMDGFLPKPFSVQQLAEATQAALAQQPAGG